MNFEFFTDDESHDYCIEIMGEMRSLFNISEEEAVARMNREWKGLHLIGDDLIYHESPSFWAKNICYGSESHWWVDGVTAVIKAAP
ncbi:MAG: hypothetical protein AAF485_20750 [Chloroflexota bacterium]